MVPVDVTQIPPRLNNIPHSPLQLLRLGEPSILSSIPQDFCGCRLCAVRDAHDERPAGGWLKGYFAESG